MNHPKDIIRLMRPWQWLKNVFVFTGVLFGGEVKDLSMWLKVIVAAAAFCLASSAIYVFNDIIDCENDKQHPKKKNRPIASGSVSFSMAMFVSFLLFVISLELSYWVSWKAVIIILGYIILNLAYSLVFKNIVILDVFCIAGGFMLRILAGTVGVGIPPSKWLLLCGFMITLFLGFAKRRAEILGLSNKEEHRKVLASYSPVLLDEIIAICATGTIISYSLYTMSPETIRVHHTESLIYTVPFVIYALFRYIFLLHHSNRGQDPSRDLIKDPHILISVLGWACLTFYLTSRV